MPNQTIEIYVPSRWESHIAAFDIMGYEDCIESYYEFMADKAPELYITYETQEDTYGAWMFNLYESGVVKGGVQPLENYTYIGYTKEVSVADIYDKYFSDTSKSYKEKLLYFIFEANPLKTYLSRKACKIAHWKPKTKLVTVVESSIGLYIADTESTRKYIAEGKLGEALLYPSKRRSYCIYTVYGDHIYDTFKGNVCKMKPVVRIATVTLPKSKWEEPIAKGFAKYCSDNYPSNLSQTRGRFNNWLINLFLTNKSTYHGKFEFLLPIHSDENEGGRSNRKSSEVCRKNSQGIGSNYLCQDGRNRLLGREIVAYRAENIKIPNRRLFCDNG